MVNIGEYQRRDAESWVIEVMPSMNDPVTHWLVVGPYYDSGSVSDDEGNIECTFEDGEEALAYAREAAEDSPYEVKVVVYPLYSIA